MKNSEIHERIIDVLETQSQNVPINYIRNLKETGEA